MSLDSLKLGNRVTHKGELNLLEQALEEAHTSIAEEVKEPEKLPENSPTLLIDEYSSRFSSAEWYEEVKKKDNELVMSHCC